MIISTMPSGWVTASKNNGDQLITLHPDEQRELLEALARRLGATVTFPEAIRPTESAWVVIPQTPGMPVSDGVTARRSGFNMLPCGLEVAKEAAGDTPAEDIYLLLPTITEAFKTAVEHYQGRPAYIIGNGAYSVIV